MDKYAWERIEDLPKNWRELSSKELESLSSIWIEQSEKLKESDALKIFNERLRRQWAIETGIIENLYTIDRGITQLLIEKGIIAGLIPHGSTDKPVEHIISILHDQENVLIGLFDFVAKRRHLSASYIKEIHQALTFHQGTVKAIDGMGKLVEIPLIRGEWKNMPNNPTRTNGSVHEYCPPVHITSEIDHLVKMHQRHIDMNVPPEVEASWLHHRFTQIHPFQDGNGRVARALASLVFLRAGWFPLVIHRDIREEYIKSLEEADSGSLRSLVNLFAKIQKKEFVKALSISEYVLHYKEPIKQVVYSAVDRLKVKSLEKIEERRKVFTISNVLEDMAEKQLREVADVLTSELSMIEKQYSSGTDRSNEQTDHWFRSQIINIAREMDYYADTRTYRKWVRLKIKEERQAELVISFHSLGVEFLGVMAVSAFIEYRDKQEKGAVVVDGPYILSEDIFQFAYTENRQDVSNRFKEWLKKVVLIGLDQWRRQL
ncbi:MAG: Fic family protein [Desulfocucumaceae bacterium]